MMPKSDQNSEYQFCAGKTVPQQMLVPANPRYVLVTNPSWMQTYCSLDEGELQYRLVAVQEHGEGFDLWLQALSMFHRGVLGVVEWSADLPLEQLQALNIRSNLLALAGSTAKPALDAILAGYYWAGFGMIRGLLETWARVAFVRLQPAGAAKWFELPDVSPVDSDWKPRPRRERKPTLRLSDIEEALPLSSFQWKCVFGRCVTNLT